MRLSLLRPTRLALASMTHILSAEAAKLFTSSGSFLSLAGRTASSRTTCCLISTPRLSPITPCNYATSAISSRLLISQSMVFSSLEAHCYGLASAVRTAVDWWCSTPRIDSSPLKPSSRRSATSTVVPSCSSSLSPTLRIWKHPSTADQAQRTYPRYR